MTELSSKTEKKILNAAEEVFIREGMSGARMQEIANQAGINKALLHYYYRTKERLFMAVFQKAASQIIPDIQDVLIADMPLFDKIPIIVDKYTRLLLKKPFLPLFILHEISRKPDQLAQIIQAQGIKPELIQQQISKEIEAGIIKPVNPMDLVINILSLVIFPVAAKPMLQRILFSNDKKAYKEFLKSRNEEVPKFIINAIKK